jgi:uncharacterized protein (DUF2141 family)
MLHALFRFLGRICGRRSRSVSHPFPVRHRLAPRVEPLEDRWLPSCVTIGGVVFEDANNNGLFDVGENTIAGNAVELHDAAGRTVATAVTDAQGRYAFTANNLVDTAPTTQVIPLTFDPAKTNWTNSQSVAQFNPDLGKLTSVEIVNDGDFTSQIQIESLDGAPSNVTGTVSGNLTLQAPGIPSLVTSGSSSQSTPVAAFDGTIDFAGPSGHDFGTQSAHGSNSIILAKPEDLAAYEGTGTIPLKATAEATSTALGAGNLLSKISSTAAAHVQVIYHYVPNNCLRPGQYTVIQLNDPPGYLPGKDTNDNQTPLPASNPHNTIPVTIINGDSPNNNFGELLPATVSGFVYFDASDNGQRLDSDPGLADVSVTLTGTDDQGQVVQRTTQTGFDGSYRFTDLRPGTYALAETQPADFLDGQTTVGTQGGVAANNQITGLVLREGTNGTNNNFGELLGASVGGQVYFDANQNGLSDPGESGIAWAEVTLTGTGNHGNPVHQTQLTGADGAYNFTGLRAGNYTITETQPEGYLQGINSLGNLGGTQEGDQFFLALAQGQTGVNYNFGEFVPAPPPAPLPDVNPFPIPLAPPLSKRDFVGGGWMLFGT